MRCRIPGLALVLAAATACSAPRPAEMPQTVHATVRDVVLRAENAVIEARVPRNATLDSILRQHQLSADLVNAAVQSAASVFNPRQLRADRPTGWCGRSTASCASSSTRSTPTASCASSTATAGAPRRSTPRCSRSRRTSTVVAIHGDIDAEHSSLIAAMGESGREHPAGDGARRDLRRSDRLQQRSPARRSLRGAVREVDARGAVRRLRHDPRRHVRRRRQASIRPSAGSIPRPARPPTTTRRADR